MASRIVQRLVAAGASPERARAFEQQFTQRVQSAQPSITKPKDIQDAFDAEIATFAAAAYPNVFRPPTIDDPRINDYIKGAYGQNVLDSIQTKSFQFKAPDLYKVLTANPNIANTPDEQLGLDAYIVKKIYIEQKPIGEVKNLLASGAVKDPKTKKSITGTLLPSEYGSLVDKYAGQDAAQLEEETKLKGDFLKNDKYYKVGLPTPNLRYGKEENLAEGVIDYKTHPSVNKYLNSPEASRAKAIAQSPATSYIAAAGQGSMDAFKKARQEAGSYEERLFNAFLKSGAVPFTDEVKRRESLKKTTTLGK